MSSLFSCFGPRKPQAAKSSQLGDANGNHIKLNEKPAGRAFEAHLPRAADDSAVREKVAAVFDQIDKYVEDFYRDKTFLELDAGHEACLTLVGTPYLPSSPIDLVQSNRPNPIICRPTSLIKHCIAYQIQLSMTMDEGGRNSLLPPWATSLPQALRHQEHDDKRVFDEAFTHWRVLTAYLQPSADSPAAKMSRTSAIRAIADRIGGAFTPWEYAPGSPEQRASLVAICESATEASSLIFAQPAAFSYVWEPTNLGEDEVPRKVVVVKPGLVKTVVEKGGMEKKEEIMPPSHISLTFAAGHSAT
ncbi:hypothetical protein SLS56_010920 [Neofusicoccum ribis]|uniref:Uncharacterized protein n=1 Tax=Neofusicoccum ribis TaxID=45134 RepID=A0ABR3SDW1_9PEZI